MNLPSWLEQYISPEPNSGCWLWTSTLDKDGYPLASRSRKLKLPRTVRAHRALYELVVGVIPDDMTLDHLCRLKCCVNPKHMEVVTNKINILRSDGRCAINARKTHCKEGHEFDAVGSRGERRCSQCYNLYQKLYKRRG